MRTPMIAANWKMNTTISEATKLVKEIQPELNSIHNIDKIVCPPFISLWMGGPWYGACCMPAALGEVMPHAAAGCCCSV